MAMSIASSKYFVRHSYDIIWYRYNIPSGIKHSHGKWSIEIDGLPFLNMVIFHGYVNVYRRVDIRHTIHAEHKDVTCDAGQVVRRRVPEAGFVQIWLCEMAGLPPNNPF